MKEKRFNFPYDGTDVHWTFQRIDTSNWGDNQDLSTCIACEHPIFIKTIGAPFVFATSLSYLVQIGKQTNKQFFEEMLNSFFNS